MKLKWILEVAKGMLHLHTSVPGKEVIHRDLAARNILLKDGHAVVADFGQARIKENKDDQARTQSAVGPLKWEAPESLRGKNYSTKSDVYSFGVVIFEIISEEPPWEGMSVVEAGAAVLGGKRLKIDRAADCPQFVQDVMNRCFAENPADRPGFDEICDILQLGLHSAEKIAAMNSPSENHSSEYFRSPNAIEPQYTSLNNNSSSSSK